MALLQDINSRPEQYFTKTIEAIQQRNMGVDTWKQTIKEMADDMVSSIKKYFAPWFEVTINNQESAQVLLQNICNDM